MWNDGKSKIYQKNHFLHALTRENAMSVFYNFIERGQLYLNLKVEPDWSTLKKDAHSRPSSSNCREIIPHPNSNIQQFFVPDNNTTPFCIPNNNTMLG